MTKRASSAERTRQQRARAKKRGLCPRCYKRKPAKDRNTCSSCLVKQRATANARTSRHKASGLCWRCKNKTLPGKVECRRHNDLDSLRRFRHKITVLAAYGGECACCGESHPDFLSIDHIDGGGTQHRKSQPGGVHLYRWLKANDYPAGFQTLCFNCNFSKHLNGKCVHRLLNTRAYNASRPKQTRGRLPDPLFTTCIADPNWSYDQFGQKKHGAQRAHYKGSSRGPLSRIPVSEWLQWDANLFLWATSPKIEEAIDVMRAWGFHVVTMVPWVKTITSSARIKRGIGHWGYSAAEYLLVCRRGNAKAPKYRSGSEKPFLLLAGPRENPCFYDPQLHDWLSDPDLTSETAAVFYAKLGPHSRKPLSLFEWLEAFFSGNYLELFSKGSRAGWTCVGHKTGWHMNEEGVIPIAEAIERGLVQIGDF